MVSVDKLLVIMTIRLILLGRVVVQLCRARVDRLLNPCLRLGCRKQSPWLAVVSRSNKSLCLCLVSRVSTVLRLNGKRIVLWVRVRVHRKLSRVLAGTSALA